MPDAEITSDAAASSRLVQPLQMSQEGIEWVLANVSTAIAQTNAAGQIAWCNSAFDRLFNRPHGALLHQPFSEVLPLPFVQAAAQARGSVQLGDRVVWLQVARSSVHTSAGEGTVYILQDVTQDVTAEMHLEAGRAEAATEATEAGDRQRTALALADSEAKLRRLAENIPGMIYRYIRHPDGSHEFTYVSSRCRDIYEVEPAEVLQNAQVLHETFHPDDLLAIETSAAQSLQLLKLWHVEHRIITRSGRLKWVQVSTQPEQQPNGDIVWDGVATEITDRKLAEARLKQQQNFLRMVIDTNPNMIFVKDYQGCYVLANQAMANFYGTTVEELTGKTVLEQYFDSELVERFLNQNRWVIRNRQPLFIPEEKIESNHHGIEWLQWQKQPIHLLDRDEYGVLGIGVNITERKRTEAALQSIVQGTASATGAEFFPMLVQSLVSALGVRHAIVTELTAEQTLSTLAFWSDDAFQPTNIAFDLSLPIPCVQTLQQQLWACASHLRTAFPNMGLLEQMEAESYLGAALLDADGSPIGVLCIIDSKPLLDIPRAQALLQIFAARAAAELERKRASAALEQLNQDLEARVAERTQALLRSQTDLQNQTQLLQTILNSMGDGLIVADTEGKSLVFNPAAEEILGMSAITISSEEWAAEYGIYLSDRLTLCPLDELPMTRAIRGEVADNVEVFVRNAKRPNGVLVNVTLRPLYDQFGQISGGVTAFRDITCQKETEEILRSREQEFRTLIEHSPDLIIRFDRQIRYLYVNPKVEEEMGIPSSTFMNKTVAEMGFPDLLAAYWTEGVERTFATGEEQLLQYELDLLSGRQIDEARCVPEFAADGSVKSVMIVARHITALKQVEAALRESEAQLSAIFENAPIAIGLASLSTGQFVRCNAAHRDQLGYSDAEVKTLTIADISHPEDMALDQNRIDQVLAGAIARFQMQKRFVRRDGTLIWCNLTVALIPDAQGRPLYLMGMTEDISDRKQTEHKLLIVQEQLFIAQERLQHLLSSSPAIIYSATPDDRPLLTFISTNVTMMLGYESQQCLETHFWTNAIHSEDIWVFWASQERLLEHGYTTCEYRFRLPDGSYRWVYDQSKLVRDDLGNPLERIGSWTDIDDRKAAEEQLCQINERLALTNAELARATRLKDEFLANMSHELRTPLNSILGLSEVMQEEVFGALTDKQRQFLNTIQDSGRHLLELINDILDLAKIEAGMLDLHISETSIQSLCETSLALMQQQAHQKTIALSCHLSTALSVMHVDERRMRQVLLNLLSNAIKFTPEGGSVRLEVQHDRPTSSLSFSVIDTGIGIAPDDMDRLFQTFVQLDSSLARHYEGTGLGLVLVKQIVELHGGQITVVSEVGRGSCFQVTLPWSATAQDSEGGLHRLAYSGLAAALSPQILLVEENADVVATLVDYLQAKGFRLVLARDGIEALQQAIAHAPDLILMGLSTPNSAEELAELEAMQQLRSELTQIPIIALTAATLPEDQEKCRLAGATDSLAKPIRLKQLADSIQQHLNSAV